MDDVRENYLGEERAEHLESSLIFYREGSGHLCLPRDGLMAKALLNGGGLALIDMTPVAPASCRMVPSLNYEDARRLWSRGGQDPANLDMSDIPEGAQAVEQGWWSWHYKILRRRP